MVGIAAALAAGYPAGAKSAKKHHAPCGGNTSKSSGRHAKRRPGPKTAKSSGRHAARPVKCKKPRKAKTHGNTTRPVAPMTTTPPVGTTGTETGTATTPAVPPEEALKSATIVVHVYDQGGPAGCTGTKCPAEQAPVYVDALNPDGEVLSSFHTTDHRISVEPGEYEVAQNSALLARSEGKKVTVAAGQTSEVTLSVQVE
jgi:hypothetical protein